jgi:uncharacterized membrane protein
MKRVLQFLFSRLLKYFLQGMIFIAPVGITAVVLYTSFVYLDNLIPLNIPGLGIFLVIVLTILVGFASGFVAAPVFNYFERILTRAPLIKIIYTSVKDLLSAFVGNKRKFNRPVIVKLDKESDIERLGFLTEEKPNSFGVGAGKVTVYLPYSYSMMGVTLIVPQEQVRELNLPPAEVMKYIVSGGVTRIDSV